jgi:hypothetical protein
MHCWGVAVVLVASCGGKSTDPPAGDAPTDGPVTVADPPDQDDRSGSRLKRRLIQSADGARDHVGWFDSLTGANCTFFTQSDGVSRCVPFSADVLEMFTDPTCETRILRSSAALPTGYFSAGALCGPTWFRDPVAAATPAMVFSKGITGNCFQSGLTTGTFFTATEAALSEFVGSTVALEPNGSALMSRVRTTDDGGREFLQLFSPALDAECTARPTADEAVRCAPRIVDTGSSSPESFADAQCTQLVRPLTNSGSLCNPATYRGDRANDRCGPSVLHFAPLTPYSGPLFESISNVCQPKTGTFEGGLVGERIDPATFVEETERAVGEGSSRVRTFYSVYADGSVGPRGMFDTRHGIQCEFADDSEGVERCQPEDYLDLGGFADAACTVPLADSSGDPCPPEIRPAWARATNGVFFRVTGEFTGATAFAREGNACFQITLGPDVGPLFTVDPTPVTDWEVGERIVEP